MSLRLVSDLGLHIIVMYDYIHIIFNNRITFLSQKWRLSKSRDRPTSKGH